MCKEAYEDYLEHVEGSMHRKNVHKSKVNKDIAALCEQFKPQQPSVDPRPELTKDETIEFYELPMRKMKRTESIVESP